MTTKTLYTAPRAEIYEVSIEPIALSINGKDRTEILNNDPDEIDL